MRPQRHVAGLLRCRQRARVAAEVGAERTTANALIAALTHAALRAVRQRRGHVRDAPDREAASELLFHRLLEMQLDAIELHRRLKLAVGELRQAFRLAAHADERLHVVVPGRDIRVADRPIDAMPVLRIRREIDVAPPIALARPHERAPADVIAAHPIEALDLDVGIVDVVDEPVLRCLRDRIPGPSLNALPLEIVSSRSSAVFELPRVFRGGRILAVPHHAATFEHERLEAFFGELLRGPPAAHPSAYDDGVVSVLVHQTPRLSMSGEDSAQRTRKAIGPPLMARSAERCALGSGLRALGSEIWALGAGLWALARSASALRRAQ